VVTFLAPGLRFFQHGQLEGRTKRISPHLCRAPDEPVNTRLARFYDRLLALLRQPIFRHGKWQLLECAPAWDGNGSSDAFIAYAWEDSGARILVAVNYSDHPSQCYARLPFSNLHGRQWQLRDLIGEAQYERNGTTLESQGLFLDVGPWQYHVFNLSAEKTDDLWKRQSQSSSELLASRS